MASTSETGHAKNVANFQVLINYVTAYGPQYNPTKDGIKLPQLQAKLTEADNAVKAVNTAVAPLTNLINQRQAIFKPLSKLATRLINALDASDVADAIVDDARTVVRKIQGNTKRSAAQDDNSEQPTRSNSQLSFDMRIDSFHRLIELLRQQTAYAPNETALQVATLDTLHASMIAANNSVKAEQTRVSNARIIRDQSLYDRETGLVHTASECKKYVKSLFGTSAPQFKQISALKFTYSRAL